MLLKRYLFSIYLKKKKVQIKKYEFYLHFIIIFLPLHFINLCHFTKKISCMADLNQNKTHHQDKNDKKYQYRCVMLVDDNEIDNIINEKIIEANNFSEKILVFQTGADSLKYLSDHQHDIEMLPEIIFLDINMPVMDGFQYLEEFEKYNNKVKEKCRIIMLSSSISPRDIDRAAGNIHVKKYLNKPLNIRYLTAITV